MVEAVLREGYGLTDVMVEPVPLGVINRNFRVVTPTGAFALKQYSPKKRLENLHRSLTVQEYLRGVGVPVPAVQLNRSGDPVTVRDDGYFVLMEWVQGRHYTRGAIPERAARVMGETLGRLLLALEAMPAALGWEPVTPAPRSGKGQLLEHLEGLLRLAEPHHDRSRVDAAAVAILRQKLHLLERFDEGKIPMVLPRQWVHGDYQETNLLLTPDDAVAGILDFDGLNCRHRGLEMMRSLSIMFEAPDGSLVPEAWAFVTGYLTVVRPDAGEVALYAPHAAFAMLGGDWPIGARYLEPDDYDPRWDRFIRLRPNWWGADPEPVAQQFLETWRQL